MPHSTTKKAPAATKAKGTTKSKSESGSRNVKTSEVECTTKKSESVRGRFYTGKPM